MEVIQYRTVSDIKKKLHLLKSLTSFLFVCHYDLMIRSVGKSSSSYLVDLGLEII